MDKPTLLVVTLMVLVPTVQTVKETEVMHIEIAIQPVEAVVVAL